MIINKISRLATEITDWLLSRALFAAYRDRAFWPWITLARVAARIAEKGAWI